MTLISPGNHSEAQSGFELYCSSEIAKADVIFICEDEKSADIVRKFKLCATASPNGLQNPEYEDWSQLAGKTILLLTNFGHGGAISAKMAVKRLSDLDPQPRVKYLILPALSEGEGIEEFVENAHSGNQNAAVSQLAEVIDQSGFVDIQGIAGHVGQLDKGDSIEHTPFPSQILPDVLCRFINDTSRVVGVDASFIGLPLLVCLGACIGGRKYLELGMGKTFPIIWGGLVGSPSTKKTPAMKSVTRMLNKIDEAKRKCCESELKDYKRKIEIWKVDMQAWKEKRKKRPQEAGGPPDEPERPKELRLVVVDASIEKLLCLLQDNVFGLLFISDELMTWIGNMNRYTGNGGSEMSSYLSMFDGGRVSVDRISRDSLVAENALVSVIGSIQPGVLKSLISSGRKDGQGNGVLVDSGFIPRFLMAAPKKQVSGWSNEKVDPALLANVQQIMESLVAYEMPFHNKKRAMEFTEEAWARFHAFDKDTDEILMKTEDEAIESALVKLLRGYTLRFAIIIQMVRAVTDKAPDDRIELESIEVAIELAKWFKDETQKIYGEIFADEEQSRLEKLIGLIQRKGVKVKPRDIQQSHKRLWPKAELVREDFKALDKSGAGIYCWISDSFILFPPSQQANKPTK